MNKKWLIVPIVTGVLALAVIGGTALAQGTSQNSSAPRKTFAGRVAAILGLDEAKVQSAMDQARKEMADEALKTRLDAAVKSGRITQQQADDYYRWFQSRPQGIAPGGKLGAFGHPWMGRHGHIGGPSHTSSGSTT
jgi:hypothetical protein